MKKTGLILLVLSIFLVSEAVATQNFTFQSTLVSITGDSARDGYFGKPDWYQWLYKVRIVPGGGTHNGLSHFTLELEDCFEGALLNAIVATAGANGNPPNSGNLSSLTGNEPRTYIISGGNDGSTGTWGIKWDLDSPPYNFDAVGDIDYFWFSAPTNESVNNNAAAKHGNNITIALVQTPDCPTCTQPVIPEPATAFLFVPSAVLALLRRRFSS